tara:strand:+ start:10142 stop:10342 length:201 start_codon:yes stop_codon:yes gene_type:complete
LFAAVFGNANSRFNQDLQAAFDREALKFAQWLLLGKFGQFRQIIELFLAVLAHGFDIGLTHACSLR